MHRRPLLDLLDAYQPGEASDAEARERIRDFVADRPDCFERALTVGHVTGSAWIVDETRARCLLTHHRKLDRWLQLGGHADGDPDVLAVAMREAREESGLRSLRAMSASIYDCDVHRIPARGREKEHWHYDVRFLFEGRSAERLVVSKESKALAWVDVAAIAASRVDESLRTEAVVDESVKRMAARSAARFRLARP